MSDDAWEGSRMTFWTVPRLWPGQTIAVFGSGPSMSQAVADAVLDAGVPAIAVNDTYKLAPWASILFSADLTWWRFHMEHVAGFRGVKVSSQPGRPLPGVQRFYMTYLYQVIRYGYRDAPLEVEAREG